MTTEAYPNHGPPLLTNAIASNLSGTRSATSTALSKPSQNTRQDRDSSWSPEGTPLMEGGSTINAPEQLSSIEPVESRSQSTTAVSSEVDSNGIDNEPPRAREAVRRRSVQIIIEEEEKKGRFTLTAEDPEFRDILRASIEREAARLSGKSRNRLRDLVFTRQFTTFDRQNPRGAQSPFHGFFTLFWLAMALLLVKVAAHNYKTQGSVFGRAEILHMMVDHDLMVLLATDGLMTLSTGLGFLLQKAIAAEYLAWNRSGRIIQSVWQFLFTFVIVWFCFYRAWSWTHTVFIVLHNIVFLMKQHSYAFYNGYLSQVRRRTKLLEQKLKQLEHMEAQESPSSTFPDTRVLSATALNGSSDNAPTQRHRSIGPKYSTDFTTEESEIASMAEAMEGGKPLDAEQIQTFTRVIRTEITILSEELRGNCSTTDNAYPKNLNLSNWLDWVFLPTLVYELEYPRQEKISYLYIAEKSAATLGVIWVMIIVSQAFLYPVVVETVRHKEAGMSLDERWREFPWVLSDMMFPMVLEYLLSWYVIWECVLNVLAEITRFADRGFYGDWWNSVSWDQYARDWNRPVHNFLLRHVYHSSISAFHLSKMTATLFTFLLSAVVHELLMFCIFKKVRGYLFIFQLSQLPLAMLSRTRLLKGKDTLGNIIFWFGLFIGPSLITSLYLIV